LRADIRQQASDLRKSGRYADALPVFVELQQSGDEYGLAGSLNCLRKLGRFDEALALARRSDPAGQRMDWTKAEIVWTHIQGRLLRLPESASLNDMLAVADDICRLGPEDVAMKAVAFAVAKKAKNADRWDIAGQWIEKVNPDALSGESMRGESGREGWSDKSLWHNYRVRALVETGRHREALPLAEKAIAGFPAQRRFFLRLKALALHGLGDTDSALDIYQSLCAGGRADWWMVGEYGRMLVDAGKPSEGIPVLAAAAQCRAPLDLKVKLVSDLGNAAYAEGQPRAALCHFLLCRSIRTRRNWSVPDELARRIEEITGQGDFAELLRQNEEELLRECQNIWARLARPERSVQRPRRNPRKGMIGAVRLGPSERPFCYIVAAGGESVFAWKQDLPVGLSDGAVVDFTASPSYDKKKGRESWKASDVRLAERAQTNRVVEEN